MVITGQMFSAKTMMGVLWSGNLKMSPASMNQQTTGWMIGLGCAELRNGFVKFFSFKDKLFQERLQL